MLTKDCGGLKRAANVSEAVVRNARFRYSKMRAFPHEGKNGGEAEMFPDNPRGPSTGGGLPPRSGAGKHQLVAVPPAMN